MGLNQLSDLELLLRSAQGQVDAACAQIDESLDRAVQVLKDLQARLEQLLAGPGQLDRPMYVVVDLDLPYSQGWREQPRPGAYIILGEDDGREWISHTCGTLTAAVRQIAEAGSKPTLAVYQLVAVPRAQVNEAMARLRLAEEN